MLAALISQLVTILASGYLANRKEKAVAKQKLASAKMEKAQVTKVQSDANWEEVAIEGFRQQHQGRAG